MMARAVRVSAFDQVRQPISGFAMGWRRRDVWRVEISVGRGKFVSNTTYASEKAAKDAASRLGKKYEGEE